MNEPIRILQVVTSMNLGGIQSFLMNIYRNIDKEKVQFDFIVHAPLPHFYSQELLDCGAKIYVFPKYTVKNSFVLKKKWNSFFEEHREYNVLHSHIRSYASLYISIAKKHGLKTIIHSHSTSNGKGVNSVVKRIMQYPLRKKGDYLFACSQISGEWLYGKNALTKSNYRMIPNAVDIELYTKKLSMRNDIRHSLGVSENEILYGHVGRFHVAKNHKFLLEVFSLIKNDQPESKLLIVGDGELREEIEKKIEEYQLCDSVILTGARQDIPELMAAMDCFLFPSLWEGLPLTVVEAQASGLPCIISDQVTRDVNISELVNYVPITNACEWKNAALKIDMARKDVSEEIRNAGFDIKKISFNLMNFYMEFYK